MDRRRRFAFLSILSLVLFVVFVALWLNSFQLEYFPPGILGFKWHPTNSTPQLQCVWLIAAPAGIIFGVIAVRSERMHERRARLGLCLHCGYDLRETTGRCPECGRQTRRHANVT